LSMMRTPLATKKGARSRARAHARSRVVCRARTLSLPLGLSGLPSA
jgi:hypothetical protein